MQNSNRFYNQAVIATGKIAPQGWKIPDITEWNILKTYLKDDAATLKTGIWTSNEGTPQANNKTGFNGKPVGIYSKDGEKAIIPVKIDNSQYNKKFKLLIRPLDYIDYQENPQNALKDLLRAINKVKEDIAQKQ